MDIETTRAAIATFTSEIIRLRQTASVMEAAVASIREVMYDECNHTFGPPLQGYEHEGGTCTQCGINQVHAAMRKQSQASSAVPASCRQRLKAEGKPYPKSSCDVCGKFSPDAVTCDVKLANERLA